MNPAALMIDHYLAPLRPWLNDPKTQDVAINGPGKVWVRQRGTWTWHAAPELSLFWFENLSICCGSLRQQNVDAENPILDTETHDKLRYNSILFPHVDTGLIAITIRRHQDEVSPIEEMMERYDTTGWNEIQLQRVLPAHEELLVLYRDKRPEAIIEFLKAAVRSRQNILLLGPTGAGKAQPLHSNVLTPTGWRTIGSLSVGDPITCPDGTISSVAGIFPQGQKDIYRITFCDGRSVECCDDHLWKVWKHTTPYERGKTHATRRKLNGGADWVVAPLHEIRGWLSKPHTHRAKRCAVPLVSPCALEFPPQPLPISPYVMGVFLGDASFVVGPTVRLSTADEEIKSRVSSELPDYKITHVKQYDYNIVMINPDAHRPEPPAPKLTSARQSGFFQRNGPTKLFLTFNGKTQTIAQWARDLVITPNALKGRFRNGWTIDEALEYHARPVQNRVYSPLAIALQQLGLRYSRSPDKFIPDIYKRGSVAQRLAVLQGLMDTEGSVGRSGTQASFTSTSERLAKDVQEVAWSLGARARIAARRTHYTYKGNRKVGHQSWRVHIIHPDISQFFSLPRKLDKCVPKTARHRLQISSVEKVGHFTAACISITDPRQLYVTDNYVVTHNTTLLMTLAREIPTDKRVVTLEDAQEIKLPLHDNKVQLLFQRDAKGDNRVEPIKLARAALRMHPDVTIIGELRGEEAWVCINDILPPHPGSLITAHGNSADSGFMRVFGLCRASGDTASMGDRTLARMIAQNIDIIAPLYEDEKTKRFRFRPVWFVGDALARGSDSMELFVQ